MIQMALRNALILLLLPSLLGAQEKLVETLEVRVTNVDVVVTDRSGNPVPGLTADDFEVFENRQPQAITNFYEVRPEKLVALETRTEGEVASPAEEPPQEMRTRRIVIFIDNYTIHPVKRNMVFDSIDRAVEQLLRPGDEAMLVTWFRGTRIAVKFTSDRAALRKALDEQRRKGGGASTIVVEKSRIKSAASQRIDLSRQEPIRYPMSRAYEQSRAEVVAFADASVAMSRQLYADLNAVLATLAGVEGKKVMLYAGGELSENPGVEMFEHLAQLFGPQMPSRVSAGTAMMDVGPGRNLSHLLRGVANRANANGVTMYMIDAGDHSVLAEKAGIDPPGAGFMEEANTMMAMNLVASMTGGIAVSGTRNFDVALEAIARDLDSYYSLGYRSSVEKEGHRGLVVKARNPAYRVRARSSYSPKTTEEMMADRVVAGVFHRNMKSELPIEVRTGPPQTFEGGQFKVPVTVVIPSSITTIPDGTHLQGSFSVYFVVGNQRGDLSNVARKTQPIRFPAAAEKGVRASPFTYTATLVMRPGENVVSVGVLDDVAGTYGVATATVLAR